MKRRKLILWLVASLTIAVLLLVLAFRMTGGGEWEAMIKRIDELRSETRLRKEPRSVLHGEPVAGNAWEEYNLAMNDGPPWPGGEVEARYAFEFFRKGNASADRAKVERLLAEHQEMLHHLRLGAQRTDGQYPYRWVETGELIPTVGGGILLANIAAAQARLLAEKGRAQEAADLLLDVVVFARDSETNGPVLSLRIGAEEYKIALDELRHLLLSGKLNRAELLGLEHKLEIADRDFLTLRSAFSNHLLSGGLYFMNRVSLRLGSMEWRYLAGSDWRFALAPRRSAVEAFSVTEDHVGRYQKTNQMEFEAARKEIETVYAENQTSNNPLVRAAFNLTPFYVEQRELLARLRLLRAGARFLAAGEVPTLPDPLGKNLFSRQDGSKTKIWSVGSDGKNQSGAGDWDGKPDMVLEIQSH